MKISKTKFIELVKANNETLLDQLIKNKEINIIELNDNINDEDLINLEKNNKNKDMFYHMLLENDAEKIDTNLEMMLPFYNELEIVSGNIIKEMFGGNVIYDLNTFNQKSFKYDEGKYSFYCFLDGYQEDSNNIRIFETKATTSTKFSVSSFPVTFNKKEKRDFFIERNGIYYPLEDLNIDITNSNYYEIEKKLFDINDDRGKYVYDLAFQKYVFSKAKSTNKHTDFFLIVLNHEYKYDGKKDDQGINVYSKDLLKIYNLTSIVNKMVSIIEKDKLDVIYRIEEVLDNNDSFKMYSKDNDFKITEDIYKELLSKESILNFLDKSHGFKSISGEKYSVKELITKFGYYKMSDLELNMLNRENNVIQRNVILNNKPYYNKEKIKKAISLLKYPIYHLDFESFNAPIPRFKGEKPYMQSLFQFSVHIEKEAGICDKEKDHYSYLMKDHNDNREELIKELLNVIKDDEGSILVYNVSFERTRLKELGELFPKYKQKLDKLISRLFDLHHIVKTNKKLYLDLGFNELEASTINFYHKDLVGSYSIKKVLPIFSNLSYDNLVVSNGMEAMAAYVKFPILSDKEFLYEYNELVKYCQQDTYAMHEILKKLREI